MSGVIDDMLKIVGLDDSEVTIVKKSGIKTFTNMKTLSAERFEKTLEAGGLNAGLVADVMAFRQWYQGYRVSSVKDTPVEKVFTQDVWDEFLDSYDPEMTVKVQQAAVPTPSSTTASDKKFKLETKDLPTLPKNETIQDKYNTWEEQFLAHIGMGDCDLTDILEDSYVVPTLAGDDLLVYQKKDKLIKNAMMLATRDTHAYGFVDATKTGREIFLSVRKAYRGKDHKAKKARDSSQELHAMNFDRNSALSPNAFVAKFLSCMKEMALNGTPLYTELQKSTFVAKITHPDFAAWSEVTEKSDEDFNDTILSFRDKASKLRKTNGPKGDRVNGKVQHTDGWETVKGKGKKGKKNWKPKSTWLPDAEWAKLTKEERKAHNDANPKSKKNSKEDAGVPKPINRLSRCSTMRKQTHLL
jgi:hypothetical protein